MAAFFSPTLSRSDALSDGTHRQFGRWYRSQPTPPPALCPPVGCDTPKRAASEAARFLLRERETKLALRPHQATGNGAMTISTAHRQMSN